VSQKEAPLKPHSDSDSVEHIESFDWPPASDETVELEQPPTGGAPANANASRYEYILFDEPEPRRRVARLVRSIKRLDVASVGLYHPTLVPLEDKRIAGVSNRKLKGCHTVLKSNLLMNVQRASCSEQLSSMALPLIWRAIKIQMQPQSTVFPSPAAC